MNREVICECEWGVEAVAMGGGCIMLLNCVITVWFLVEVNCDSNGVMSKRSEFNFCWVAEGSTLPFMFLRFISTSWTLGPN